MLRSTVLPALLGILAGTCGRHVETPLAAAAARGDRNALNSLVQAGKVNAPDSRGCTALIAAARAGQVESIQTLVRLGADPDLRGGGNDWTPIMHAIHKFRHRAVTALLDAGADPNFRTRSGLTALTMAAGYGDARMVRLLLSHGANPRDGRALAAAVSGVADIDKFTLGDCQTETVHALLDAAPDLRLPNTAHGRWARRLASWGGCAEVVQAVRP